jgi:hypothetical protein
VGGGGHAPARGAAGTPPTHVADPRGPPPPPAAVIDELRR